MKIREFAMMLSLSAVLGLIACGSDDANPASDGGVSGSTMVDSRDGQSYRIVKIGKQTWMAQNLNYAAPNSVCYDNNPDFCTVYGRLYFYESVPPDVIGKLGTPLSKIRSIAMDDSLYTLGLPVYVDTTLSDGQKFRRLMIAQDTGSAIRGFVRADIFFGKGDGEGC